MLLKMWLLYVWCEWKCNVIGGMWIHIAEFLHKHIYTLNKSLPASLPFPIIGHVLARGSTIKNDLSYAFHISRSNSTRGISWYCMMVTHCGFSVACFIKGENVFIYHNTFNKGYFFIVIGALAAKRQWRWVHWSKPSQVYFYLWWGLKGKINRWRLVLFQCTFGLLP